MNQHGIAKLWERAMAAEKCEDWAAAKRHYHEVADAAPKHAPTFQRLGLIALHEGRPRDAMENLQRSLSIEPADPVCLNNLGNVLRELGRVRESASAYGQALIHRPGYPSALYNLAGAFALLGECSKAIGAYRELLLLTPGDAEAWNALGLSLLDAGDLAGSRKALEEARRLKPNDADILNGLGVVHQFEGNFDTAGRLYLASIESDPGFARAYGNLVRSRRMTADDIVFVEPIEKIAYDESRDDESRLIARHALGKVYDDLAEYDKAFENYAIGNALKHRMVDFNAAEHNALVERILAEYDEAFFRAHAGEGNPSTRPVFVIGMIRSGTSLVEQILASHSRVYGAGELLRISGLVTNLPAELGTAVEYPECIRYLNENVIRGAANGYLEYVANRNDQALRVIDKLPTNFLYLGFIATLFPNARVIHCRRGVLDVCLSIYFQHFAKGHLYAYSFDDIAAYYAEYERLMRHWRSVLSIEILDVQYEQLLDDLECESRRMLNYCELDWEDACFSFHRSHRPVRTASSWQVRQPLYQTAKARWKKFDRHLNGLKKALSDRSVRLDSAE